MYTKLPPQRVGLGQVTHEIKVTCIAPNTYGCRVFTNGELNAENIAESRNEIGAACKDLLRWEDKCGNISHYADRARHR